MNQIFESGQVIGNRRKSVFKLMIHIVTTIRTTAIKYAIDDVH